MDPNERQLQLLTQILKWTREAALPLVLKRIGPLLDTDAKKRVYRAIEDGKATPRKLEQVAGVSRDTAHKLIDEWAEAGMVEPGSNPPKAVFTLAELGIPLPGPKPAPGKTSQS